MLFPLFGTQVSAIPVRLLRIQFRVDRGGLSRGRARAAQSGGVHRRNLLPTSKQRVEKYVAGARRMAYSLVMNPYTADERRGNAGRWQSRWCTWHLHCRAHGRAVGNSRNTKRYTRCREYPIDLGFSVSSGFVVFKRDLIFSPPFSRRPTAGEAHTVRSRKMIRKYVQQHIGACV